jgi:hypothetical protein
LTLASAWSSVAIGGNLKSAAIRSTLRGLVELGKERLNSVEAERPLKLYG